MTRVLPESLRKKQEEQKKETMEKVQEAIDTIIEEGGLVTKKKLIEFTGLSNATFSKEHIKDVLKKNTVCQFKKTKQVVTKTENKETESLQKNIDKLVKENNLLHSKMQDKEIELFNQKQSYAALLGKLHIIMRKVNEKGIDIGIDFDNL